MKKEPVVLPADPNDTEDGDVTAAGLDRAQRARLIRKVRTGLGLSQTEFASRFRIPVGTLRDWEQARATAPDYAVAYVRVIGLHPDIVAKAVGMRVGDLPRRDPPSASYGAVAKDHSWAQSEHEAIGM